MNIEQVKLDNELNVLLINSPGSTAGTVQMWFRAGSALEKTDHEGIAHFLEHMFFKGTPTRPGAGIAHEIESYGGEVNAFTSFDYTCYYINTPHLFIDRSVNILIDMVANPMFLEEDIPAERQVVFEEYRRALDNPSQFNFMQLQKSGFSGGYEHPILGREETILNFSREQLTNFRNKYYNLENAMLVIAGDLKNKEEILKAVSKVKMPHGDKSSFGEFKLKNKPTINVHDKDIRQATLSISIQAPSYGSEKAAAQDLAINCLAHGETSRLYQALVAQNSTCNGVAGSSMYFANGGAHMMKMNFPPENLTKVLAGLEKTLKDIVEKGFKNEEVLKIKNQYIASKVYEKESIESFAFSLGHGFAQSGNIFCEEEFIERVRAASVEQVMDGLVEIFHHSLHLTLQMPRGQKLPQAEKTLKSWQEKLSKYFKSKKLKETKTKIIGSDFDPKVHVVEIKPGIKFIYRQNKMTPTFVLHTYLKGGVTAETEKTAGQHHLLSRLLTYGYKGMPYNKLKNELENLSAYLSGFSGKNAYGLTLHGQTKDQEGLFKHFFGTLNSPEVPTKFFAHEKKITLRALDNQKEDPVKQAFKAFYRQMFHGHPYSLDISGTPETLKSMSATSLKKLHLGNLKKQEMVITYCGDQEWSVIHPLILEMTKSLPNRPKLTKNKKKVTPKKASEQWIEMQREQTQMVIGKPAYNITQKEDAYLKMISAHLSGQSSELFVEVRDRQGLCYSVSPVHISALEAGCWAIYIGSGKDKILQARDAIFNILNNLSEKGVSREEFERIKTMIDGQNLLGIQTNEDYAQFYSIPVLHGLGVDFQHHNNQEIRDVKYEDFQKFLGSYFKGPWSVICAGPKIS